MLYENLFTNQRLGNSYLPTRYSFIRFHKSTYRIIYRSDNIRQYRSDNT